MAIAFDKVVGSGYATSTAATLTLTVASGGVASGGLCVLICMHGNEARTVTSVTDTRTNSWTVLENYSNSSTGDTFVSSIAYCSCGTSLQAGDTITITWNGSEFSGRSAICVAYSGIATSSFKDQNNHGQDIAFPQSSSLSSGNITTTSADELLVGLHGISVTGLTFTPTASFTQRSSVDNPNTPGVIMVEDRIVSSTGTYSAAPSTSNICH